MVWCWHFEPKLLNAPISRNLPTRVSTISVDLDRRENDILLERNVFKNLRVNSKLNDRTFEM